MYSKEQYMEKIENREVTISDLLKYNMKQWKKIALISVVIFILIPIQNLHPDESLPDYNI